MGNQLSVSHCRRWQGRGSPVPFPSSSRSSLTSSLCLRFLPPSPEGRIGSGRRVTRQPLLSPLLNTYQLSVKRTEKAMTLGSPLPLPPPPLLVIITGYLYWVLRRFKRWCHFLPLRHLRGRRPGGQMGLSPPSVKLKKSWELIGPGKRARRAEIKAELECEADWLLWVPAQRGLIDGGPRVWQDGVRGCGPALLLIQFSWAPTTCQHLLHAKVVSFLIALSLLSTKMYIYWAPTIYLAYSWPSGSQR